MKSIHSYSGIGLICLGAAIFLALCLGTVKAFNPDSGHAFSATYTFVTLAGKPAPDGFGSGTTTESKLTPHALALDGKGNVYFSDPNHQVICKMTTSGSITIIAGGWNAIGSADGKGSEARFRFPHGLAFDAAGNLYVADSGNDTIRCITPAGVVSTLAGKARASGSADGAGQGARFCYPCDLAVDRSGNLFVSDLYNYSIRRVTPDGVVTTFAGNVGESGGVDGPAAEAKFGAPMGLALDDSGNLYVADMGLSCIRKISPAGKVTTFAGRFTYQVGHADGKGRAAEFNHPNGLAADHAGNIYVADTDNDLIRRIAPDGTVVTLAGLASKPVASDGIGSAVHFGHLSHLALDGAGNIYVSDLVNAAVYEGSPAPATGVSVALTRE